MNGILLPKLELEWPHNHRNIPLVYTGGGVACWISDLHKCYAETVRILKRGGIFSVNEFHPFGALFSNEEPSPIASRRCWRSGAI